MNDSKISVRYAKALFQSAHEGKVLGEVMKDVDLLESTWKVEGFAEMMLSPVVNTSSKKKMMQSLFEKNVSKLSYDFLLLILKNKREEYAPAIFRNFKAFYKESEGIKSAELILSTEINKEYREKFLKILEKTFSSKIELEEKQNPDIIGGFILKVEDQQFDASIASELNKIKKKLLETTLEN